MYLFFDTETTGLSSHKDHVVQLAWVLADKDGNIVDEGCHVIRPDGYSIPTGAANIHGITTAKACEIGQPLGSVLEKFSDAATRASIIVAHNLSFDLGILKGFDLHEKTVGVIGTGNIGSVFCQIMKGFGCKVIAYDPVPNSQCEQMGIKYLTLSELYQQSDIISIHCPLNKTSYHLINDTAISEMKKGVMLINTSRGGVIDNTAIIKGLKEQRIGYVGLDVYEGEENL